ncbi:MAG: hypothetical protein IT548_02465, partial [Alphaproteobacteria bacterium]|nr:hypothetical protein [Alphaproteobacteria bacterium]
TDEDVFQTGGWTAIWDRASVPDATPGTPNGKVTYADDSEAEWEVANGTNPWGIIGSRAVRNGVGRAFSIYLDYSIGTPAAQGRLLMRNRGGTSSWSEGDLATDWRDGARHLLMAGFNPGTSEMKLWEYETGVGETLLATKSGVAVDLDVAPSGGKKARIGGVGAEGDGASIYANLMFTSVNGFLPDPVMHTDADARADLWAWAEAL